MTEVPPQADAESGRKAAPEEVFLARRIRKAVSRLALALATLLVSYLGVCTMLIVSYRWVEPPTTAVQVQRRLEALVQGRTYARDYDPIPGYAMSPSILHSVVAAEDGRFFEHKGFDWDAIETAYRDGGRRGGSTISQQLAKNLFLTTHRSYLRKALEVPLTILLELILPKNRILELYVNVIEWGDGIYGAEAAARYHFGISADRLSRRQAAAMASCLPDPLHRVPRLHGWYTNVIIRRMDVMGY